MRTTILTTHFYQPFAVFAPRAYRAGAGQYPGSLTRCVDEVDDDKPSIIDPAI
jgi:hypothetical protein